MKRCVKSRRARKLETSVCRMSMSGATKITQASFEGEHTERMN